MLTSRAIAIILGVLAIGANALPQAPGAPAPANPPAANPQPGAANPPAAGNTPAAGGGAGNNQPAANEDVCSGTSQRVQTFFESPKQGGGKIPAFGTVGNEMNITWRYSEGYDAKYPRQYITIHYASEMEKEKKSAWKLAKEFAPGVTNTTWKIPAMADGMYVLRVSFDRTDDLLYGPVTCWFDGFPMFATSQPIRIVNPVEVESYKDTFGPNDASRMSSWLLAPLVLAAVNLLM